MKFTKTIAIIATIALLTMAIPIGTMADSTVDSEGNISITDSRGITTNLTQPAPHVASFGAFATNTLVDIGFLDKAVIFDAGSEYNKSAIPEMMNMSQDRFITVSSSNKDAVIQTMLDLVDNSTWNKTTDVILGYGYVSYSTMWSELEGYGFNVVTFYPNSYLGIVQVVKDIETIVGADHNVSSHMSFVKEYIAEVLSDAGIDEPEEKVTALYASYSSNTLKLGNNGSVTVDFINFAGGINVAEDPDKASPTYAVDFSAILQLNPDFVLLDGYYAGTVEDFSIMIGNLTMPVYKLSKSWNSYCPDATMGLWTIACLFYPDHFEGDLPTEYTAGEGNISITDSRGVITNLTDPAPHVAAFGAFATNTLVDIGFLDKAVIFDAGSEYNKSAIPEMMNMSQDRFITVSSSNKDMIIQTMLDLVDNSTWNKTADVILGYGYNSYSTMWSELEGYGFNVVTFYPNSYDGIVQVVKDIETIVGANHSVSQQMAFVKEYIATVLSDSGITNSSQKVNALYASYSSNTLKLGNNNSVTVDFINFAGGVNVAEDPSKASPSYTVDFSAILQLHPEYVLLDGYYTGTAEDFSALIGDSSIIVFKLNKSWNSYCPDAMTGLWTVACLFYPDFFEGDIPLEYTNDTNDGGIDINTLIVAVAGICIILVAVGVVLLNRRKGGKG